MSRFQEFRCLEQKYLLEEKYPNKYPSNLAAWRLSSQSDKSKIAGPANQAERRAEIQLQNCKIKVTKFKMVPILRLPVLAAPSGSRHNAGTCTEIHNANISNDVNPITNFEEIS